MIIERIYNSGDRVGVEYLDELRKSSGVKQKEVAERMERSSSYVHALENTKPRYRKLSDIEDYADVLGLVTRITFYPKNVETPELKTAGSGQEGEWFLGVPFSHGEPGVKYRNLYSDEVKAPIAEVLVQYGETRLRNHRLIEKAPEMLKLLESLRGTFENLGVSPLVAEIDEILNYIKEA